MKTRSRPALLVAVLFLGTSSAFAKDFPKFERIEIDPHAGEVVYAVTHADVNGDEKDDVVAVTENAVYWYAAPDWKKRTIIKDQTVRDNVCIAEHDIDGDGQIDFALGAGWPQAGGTIQWLSRKDSLDEPWNVHFIAEIPWTHRMRWGDVLGTGTPQLTVSPLNKTEGAGVKLTAFEIPADPKKDRWKATVIDDSLNRVHNHWHITNPQDQVFTVTASQEGINFIAWVNGKAVKQHRSNGAGSDEPTKQGAGEIKGPYFNPAGPLHGRTLAASIEPMHGNAVVAYVSAPSETLKVRGYTVDDTLGRGHAVWLADFDGDASLEIVVGHSDPGTGEIKGPGVFVYQAAPYEKGVETGSKWTKHVIDDGGVATEDAFAADLTGDGKPDIVAGGRNTHNVVLYVNQGS